MVVIIGSLDHRQFVVWDQQTGFHAFKDIRTLFTWEVDSVFLAELDAALIAADCSFGVAAQIDIAFDKHHSAQEVVIGRVFNDIFGFFEVTSSLRHRTLSHEHSSRQKNHWNYEISSVVFVNPLLKDLDETSHTSPVLMLIVLFDIAEHLQCCLFQHHPKLRDSQLVGSLRHNLVNSDDRPEASLVLIIVESPHPRALTSGLPGYLSNHLINLPYNLIPTMESSTTDLDQLIN